MHPDLSHFLNKYHQLHLASYIEKFPPLEEEALACFQELDQYYPISFTTKKIQNKPLIPFLSPITSKHVKPKRVVENLLNHKVASVILAGGDGSRLGSALPKGCFPLCLQTKKSLFEIHCSKLLSLQNKLQTTIPLVILTSKKNHEFTCNFFNSNNYFGLCKDSVFFLKQPHLPFFDQNNLCFFKEDGSLASGPNGNGCIFRLLSDIIKTAPSIETFQIINIDNPLAYPIDLELLEHHLQDQHEITLRCIPLTPQYNNVGKLYFHQNRLAIIDYMQTANAPAAQYGSINIFAFSKNAIISLQTHHQLPLNWVEKTLTYHPKQTRQYLKGELFITDAIEHASSVSCLLTQAKDYFAPLKSLEGPGNLKDAQHALQTKEDSLKGQAPFFDYNLYYSKHDLQRLDVT